jgi:uncharacterized membrane protein
VNVPRFYDLYDVGRLRRANLKMVIEAARAIDILPSDFAQEFKQFFLRGLAALLPTLITLWLLVWVWNFLWTSLGTHLVYGIRWLWPQSLLASNLTPGEFSTQAAGVFLAVLLVYIIGFFVGNLIGRTFWRLGEALVMRMPVIRAIYPAVKQVTDFVLADRTKQFNASRVVAIQPHEKGIWSIGLVTGEGFRSMDRATGQEMLMVFCPNTPAAFSGYMLVVPKAEAIELPITVEEAMRLLISGGVIIPGSQVVAGGRIVTLPVKTDLPDAPREGELNHPA